MEKVEFKSQVKPTARNVHFIYVLSQADPITRLVLVSMSQFGWPNSLTLERISSDTGLHRNTVSRSLKTLVDSKIIVRKRSTRMTFNWLTDSFYNALRNFGTFIKTNKQDAHSHASRFWNSDAHLEGMHALQEGITCTPEVNWMHTRGAPIKQQETTINYKKQKNDFLKKDFDLEEGKKRKEILEKMRKEFSETIRNELDENPTRKKFFSVPGEISKHWRDDH